MVGLIGALELTPDKTTRAKFATETGKVGTIARDLSFANGLVMRATRDSLILSPPLVISHADADEIVAIAGRVLDGTLAEVKKLGLM